ncbi:MAG TPA: sodium:solute symporter family protein [Candidatus Fermentibacter sp.]|nr:sodium:solute symporter family protein [Candidatus Fermentibacter sp.]
MTTVPFWTATVLYILGMLLVGILTRVKRHIHSKADPLSTVEYWLAKRELPSWRLAMSLTAGWLMLGWVGFGMSQVYLYGTTGLWILPVPWFILCFIVIAMVPFVRRLPAVSLPQAIEKRYGPGARTLLAVLSAGVFLAWTQAELFMGGTLLAPFLGIPAWGCMILLAIPIAIYTYMGGFRAIVTTDVLQFTLAAAFMVILAATALSAASSSSGGDIIGALRQAAPPWSGQGNALNPWFLGVAFPVLLLIGYLPGWLIEQDLIQRVQAMRSTREARRGAIAALFLITTFVLVLPSIAAFCSLVAFPPVDGVPPEAIGGSALGIIPALINTMPLGLAVFMMVGIVACQMSTVDTFAQVTAMPVAYDLVEPGQIRRGVRPERRLATTRVISVLSVLAALACALVSTSLGDVYYISSGVLSACIAVPAFFIFWRRTTLPAVITAALAGLVGTVGMYWYEYKYLQFADPALPHYYTDVLPAWLAGAYGYIYVASGVVISVILIVLVSLLTKRPPRERLDAVSARPVDDFNEFVKGSTGE